jgi:hypothetical protein
MIRKHMAGSSTVFLQEGESSVPMVLEYYLLENESHYGIEIIKKKGGDAPENMTVGNLTCSCDEANRILGILVRNEVTPMTLPVILDDLIGII